MLPLTATTHFFSLISSQVSNVSEDITQLMLTAKEFAKLTIYMAAAKYPAVDNILSFYHQLEECLNNNDDSLIYEIASLSM